MLAQEPHQMNTYLNPGLQTPAEFLHPSGLLGLRSRHRQNALRQHPSPGLPHSNWLGAWALVEAYESPWLHCPISLPGRAGISHPIPKLSNIFPYPRACHSKQQQPVLEAERVFPSWSCGPQQASCDGCHRLLGDVHQHECQCFSFVGLKSAHCWRSNTRVIWSQDLQDRLACLGADVLRLKYPALLPFRDITDGWKNLALEHQTMVDLLPMLWEVLFHTGG